MESEKDLKVARSTFYAALKDKKKIAEALDLFKKLGEHHPELRARALTYTGALIGLQARDAFWPQDKLAFVNKGLKKLDAGLNQNPDDLEALFVHASACHYLPGFLGRATEAKTNFDKLINSLPENSAQYDASLINEIIVFLKENITLSPEQSQIIEQFAV